MTDSKTPAMTGGCQCGAVRYALMAEPTHASICHCRMCQKAFGNYIAPLAGVRDHLPEPQPLLRVHGVRPVVYALGAGEHHPADAVLDAGEESGSVAAFGDGDHTRAGAAYPVWSRPRTIGQP